jgi:sugar O-acyltransferase (sialic acid O-acetyltransferase NeuD family)
LTDPAAKVHVMLGAGGHARVIQETLDLQGISLHGFIAPDPESLLAECPWLGSDEQLEQLDHDRVILFNGIGSVAEPTRRRSAYLAGVRAGFRFATVVDSSAIVRPSVNLGPGVQVLAGAILNSDVAVEENSIINSGAIVEHGSRIGPHTHIAPGVTLSGMVTIGEGSHVGVGATVIQGISVGSHCVIGAGAVVTRDVPDGFTAVGVPAVGKRHE